MAAVKLSDAQHQAGWEFCTQEAAGLIPVAGRLTAKSSYVKRTAGRYLAVWVRSINNLIKAADWLRDLTTDFCGEDVGPRVFSRCFLSVWWNDEDTDVVLDVRREIIFTKLNIDVTLFDPFNGKKKVLHFLIKSSGEGSLRQRKHIRSSNSHICFSLSFFLFCHSGEIEALFNMTDDKLSAW